VPIDLPTNELYLWAMPNVEFRTPGSLFGDIYGGAMQPRFYISPFDPDQD
jgi:hypothetical protein